MPHPELNTITWEQQVGHILRLVTFKITLNATGKKLKIEENNPLEIQSNNNWQNATFQIFELSNFCVNRRRDCTHC